MKVLHIHPSMASGGIESMICSLANEMSKEHDVTVCSIFEPKPEHVFWYKLSDRVNKCTLHKNNTGLSLKEIVYIYNFIRKEKFQVVYLHGFLQYYLWSVIALHKCVKFCYTVHSDAVMENVGWSKKIFPLKRMMFAKRWITPITISNASQDSFYNLYNCSSELIYNGVAKSSTSLEEPEIIKEYRYTPRTKVFLHPGRISLAKNQVLMCKVFQRLIQEGEDVVLLIAGSRDDESIFCDLKPLFSDRIVYLGVRTDVLDMMSHSDALVLPSIWEGLPVVILEALSVGCVPIATPVGGIVDVINHDYNGLLSDCVSEDAYYNVLKYYLSLSDEKRLLLKDNCKNSFEKYNITNTAAMYINLLNK